MRQLPLQCSRGRLQFPHLLCSGRTWWWSRFKESRTKVTQGVGCVACRVPRTCVHDMWQWLDVIEGGGAVVTESDGVSLTLAWCRKAHHGGGSGSFSCFVYFTFISNTTPRAVLAFSISGISNFLFFDKGRDGTSCSELARGENSTDTTVPPGCLAPVSQVRSKSQGASYVQLHPLDPRCHS
jgi:hypothetical protein